MITLVLYSTHLFIQKQQALYRYLQLQHAGEEREYQVITSEVETLRTPTSKACVYCAKDAKVRVDHEPFCSEHAPGALAEILRFLKARGEART